MKQNIPNWVYPAVKISFLVLIFFPLLIWIGETIGESKFRILVHEQKSRLITANDSVTRKTSETLQAGGLSVRDYDLTPKKINGKEVTHGLDVSHYQGTINWKKVKRHNLGFVLVKATGGDTYVDPHFYHNWNGVREAGMIRGPYHFFYAADNPRKQAAHFLATVGELKPYDLPPVLDVEISDHVPKKQLLESVLVWLQHVEKALKRRPLIYSDDTFSREYLSDARMAKYPLWIANYEKTVAAVPSPWDDIGWAFWQYSEEGSIDGIQGTVDLDLHQGDLEELKLFIHRSKVNQ